MSRADLRFLLKVIALVLLVAAGGVIAGFKILGEPDPVSLDCKGLAREASTGALYPVTEAGAEKQSSESAKRCELTGIGADGSRDAVTVTVERFRGDASSDVDDCDAPVDTGGTKGCLRPVEGAGPPGSNGATVTLVLADGDLRVEVDVRMSAATLTRTGGLAAAAGQDAEAFALADLARFAVTAEGLAGH